MDLNKTTQVYGDKEDISAMLLSIERYAIGRTTYMVEWTISFITKNIDLLTEKNNKVMIRDIENCEYYGMDFDKEEWMKLLKLLKESDTNENFRKSVNKAI